MYACMHARLHRRKVTHKHRSRHSCYLACTCCIVCGCMHTRPHVLYTLVPTKPSICIHFSPYAYEAVPSLCMHADKDIWRARVLVRLAFSVLCAFTCMRPYSSADAYAHKYAQDVYVHTDIHVIGTCLHVHIYILACAQVHIPCI
jgi:hypothetical protein